MTNQIKTGDTMWYLCTNHRISGFDAAVWFRGGTNDRVGLQLATRILKERKKERYYVE